MPGMRITLDAAMRARDVSRPRGTAATGPRDHPGDKPGAEDAHRAEDSPGMAGGTEAEQYRDEPGRSAARQPDGAAAPPAAQPGKRRNKAGKRRRRR